MSVRLCTARVKLPLMDPCVLLGVSSQTFCVLPTHETWPTQQARLLQTSERDTQFPPPPGLTFVVHELYPYAVAPDLPVEVVNSVLKVAKDGDGDVKAGKLVPRDGGEPRVLHGRGDGVLPEPVVQLHLVEGAYTAPQLPVLANLPGDKQGIVVVVDKAGHLGRLQVVEVAVEDVEAKVAHLGLDDPEPVECRVPPSPRVLLFFLPAIIVPTRAGHCCCPSQIYNLHWGATPPL